jgi:thioredoxin 1
MAAAYTVITDATFSDIVLDSPLPVIVDFWATWCHPCRLMAPNFEALAVEYQGKVLFAKMDTDENPQTPMRYNIVGIPTLIIFQEGKEIGRIVGFQRKEDVKRQLDNALAAVA